MYARRRRRRFPLLAVLGVVAVIGAVLVAAVVLRDEASTPPSSGGGAPGGTNDTGGTGTPGGSGGTPVGSAISLSSPDETATHGRHWYNFTVTSAESGMEMGNLLFQVSSSTSGSIVAPESNWTMTVLSISGFPVATYSFVSGDWTSGATLAVAGSQRFSFFGGSSALSGQSDVLKIVGAGSYGGTTSVSIP